VVFRNNSTVRLVVSILQLTLILAISWITLSWFLFLISSNGLQLPEGGDFEALHFQLSTNFDRSTKLDLTTEPPLLGSCCYAVGFLFLSVVALLFTAICPCLDGWAFYCPVTTINTTVTLFWL
jgi:hypothetical protein